VDHEFTLLNMTSLILSRPISDMGSMGCSSPSIEGRKLDGSILNSSGEVMSTRLTQRVEGNIHIQTPNFKN
jgi:hypothetical protein